MCITGSNRADQFKFTCFYKFQNVVKNQIDIDIDIFFRHRHRHIFQYTGGGGGAYIWGELITRCIFFLKIDGPIAGRGLGSGRGAGGGGLISGLLQCFRSYQQRASDSYR